MIVRASNTSASDTLRACRTSAAVRAVWPLVGPVHDDAAEDAADDRDQALGLEDAQGLAQRRARHPEALDEVGLVAERVALVELARR